MKRIKIILFTFCILSSKPLRAEVLIVKGIVHPATGITIQQGLLIAQNGILTYVGIYNDAELAMHDTSLSEVRWLDLSGKHVYPGLIALNSTLGITEIDLVRATHDFREVGQNNADVRAIVAYNTDSKVVPTVRSNGILITEITPQGGMISGQSSAVYTAGWNWEGAELKADVAIHVHWPSKVVHRGWWAEPEDPESASNADELLILRSVFDKAAAAYENNATNPDAKTRALISLFKKEKRLMVHANAAADMVDAVTYFKGLGLNPVIVGAKEAYKIGPFLRANEVSVVLVRTHSLPTYAHWEVHNPYQLPQMLADAGVPFVITDQEHWQQRNLPFQAGTAIAYGLDPELALQSITLNAAKILGIDQWVGSLEIGKQATFIVSDGDIFDMMYSNVSLAFINGKEISLADKQKELYEEYKEKYGLKD